MNETKKTAVRPKVYEILQNVLRNARDISASKDVSMENLEASLAIVDEVSDLLMRSDVTTLN